MRDNLREVRSKVRILLGPRGEDPNLIISSLIDDEINKGNRRLCKEFGILESSWTASAVSEARFYKPPDGMVELERVDFDDNNLDYLLPDEIWKLGDDDIDIQTPTWTEDV